LIAHFNVRFALVLKQYVYALGEHIKAHRFLFAFRKLMSISPLSPLRRSCWTTAFDKMAIAGGMVSQQSAD